MIYCFINHNEIPLASLHDVKGLLSVSVHVAFLHSDSHSQVSRYMVQVHVHVYQSCTHVHICACACNSTTLITPISCNLISRGGGACVMAVRVNNLLQSLPYLPREEVYMWNSIVLCRFDLMCNECEVDAYEYH